MPREDEETPLVGEEGRLTTGRSTAELALIIMPMLIGILLSSLDATIIVASWAAVGGELKGLQSASWISIGYLLTVASLQPFYGKLSDVFGRKSCLLTAYVIFTLGCIACGTAQTMLQLILARMFAGIGGGAMTTVVSIVLSDIVPLRSRGLWHSLLSITWAFGSSIGAPLGGYLADTVFLFQAPLSVIAFVAVAATFKAPDSPSEDFKDKLRRMDFTGSFRLTLSLAALLLGLDRGGNVSWTNEITVLMLTGFAILLAVFFLIEAKLALEPVIPKRMVTDPGLVAIYASNFFSRGCAICSTFYLPLYLQVVTKRTAAEAGASLIPSVVTNVAGGLIGGMAIKATGGYWKITTGVHLVLISGSVLIVLMTGVAGRSYALTEVGLVLESFGSSCGMTTTLVALVAEAEEERAVASAVMYLFRSLGSVIPLSIGSTLLQSTLQAYLSRDLRGDNVEKIIQRARESLDFLDDLDQPTQSAIRGAYDKAMHIEFGLCVFFALATFISSLWIKEKPLKS